MSLNKIISAEFLDLLKTIDQRYLEIEAIDNNSLNIYERLKQYHDNVSLTGEENSNIGNEIHPSHRKAKIFEGYEKLISFNILYDALMNKNKVTTNHIIKESLTGSILINDSTNIDMPYCVAMSARYILNNGRDYIKDIPNIPPTNSRSFMAMCIETMFDLCNEFMGATVIHDILICLAYFTKNERENKINFYKEIYDKINDIELIKNIAAKELITLKRSEADAKKKLSKCETYEDVSNVLINYNICNTIQSWIHIIGNKFRYGYQSLFTNLNLYSPRILRDEFNDFIYPNGLTIVDGYEDEIITIQNIFTDFFSEGIKDKNGNGKIISMPVVTLAVPRDNVGSNDKELLEKEKKFIEYTLKKFSKFNNLNVYTGVKLSMCCRLLIDKQQTNNTSVNSFGVKIKTTENIGDGSLRVVTLGLPNIACYTKQILNIEKRIDYFFKKLETVIDYVGDILITQREIINDRVKNEYFKLLKHSIINPDKLNSTIGAIGLFECVKILLDGDFNKNYSPVEIEIAKKILSILDESAKKFTEKYKYSFNVEVPIPGESMAFRGYKRDLIAYPNIAVHYKEYSNQIVPLSLNVDINEKLSFENEIYNGVLQTGITHLNINGEINSDLNLKIHKFIWKNYTNIDYYALNNAIYYCEEGHSTTNKNDICSICGGHIVDIITRTVGYFKSVKKDFGKNRKEEFGRRHFYNASINIGEYVGKPK